MSLDDATGPAGHPAGPGGGPPDRAGATPDLPPAPGDRTARPVVAVAARSRPEVRTAYREVLEPAARVAFLHELAGPERTEAVRSAAALLTWDPHRELEEAERAALRKGVLVQLISAGADHLRFAELPPSVRVAGNVGAYAEPVAEHVLAMVLALAKRLLPGHAALARGEFSGRPRSLPLAGAVGGILGFGGIGRATAWLLRAVGCRIHAVNTTGRTAEPVEWCGTLEDLDAVLAASDIVVIALPLTRATRGLIGRRELELMKPRAILVNVARGPIVEESALFDHLRAHPEFSAGIDAWWEEPERGQPFRPRYPFLDLPNVLGSAHRSALVPGIEVAAARRAAENVLRFLRGEPPRGILRREDYEGLP